MSWQPTTSSHLTGYRALAEQLIRDIHLGILTPGQALPPIRQLAKQLQLTPTTISRTYRLVEQQGYLVSRIGKGTFVAGQQDLNSVIQTGQQSCNLSIIQPLPELVQADFDQVMASFAEQPMATSLLNYPDEHSLTPYQAMACQWLQSLGVNAQNPAQLVFSQGAQHALYLLITTLTQVGDKIALEKWVYPGALSICQQLGRQVVPIEMDQQGMCPQSLAEACEKHNIKLVLVVASYQNPSTAIMSIKRRQAIAKVVKQYRLWLLDDDIYGFLNLGQYPPLYNLIPEQSFYVSSLSKAILPGLRVGFIYAPAQFSAQLNSQIRHQIWMNNGLSLEIMARLYQQKRLGKMMRQQIAQAEQRQKIMRQILGQWHVESQLRSYHCWLHLPAPWTCESFRQAAMARGVIVSSAAHFSVDKHQAANAVRLSLMAPSSQQVLRQGLETLNKLLEHPPQI
ncbi:PLP-dependent aminotransferase family protein [Motilimonas eburnea]|uniref:aminotransferase-like domain-containing protein n=1 Tax=Motilimonas eburnea TaxID=1737488 RepID=UPI001E51E447|nr:PLP-dependent aminotransferase family protein [Motilimonas eburnea]MCE2572025.1 PLP-dependent aminotransferase family protein [Motilimonas eburnea]